MASTVQTATVSSPRQQVKSEIKLTENALAVLKRRYLRKGPDGEPIETVEQMFHRVASHIAAVEEDWGGDVAETEAIFYDLITSLRFLPNSPTFTGAGTPLGQLAACFVLPISDDMGREPDGIFQTLRDTALIQQTGGGTGFSFSRLRPKGAVVHSSGGRATGPVGFMRVFDVASGIVSQGGARRGANMAVLRVDHPDILEFIRCKTNEDAITNFNISVGVSDAFMLAVEEDGTIDLVNPQDGKVWKTVRAREIFDEIVAGAHRNGEPGMLFLDTANRDNPCPHLGEYEATNPCGEQPLLPYENCCLGSINLARHVRYGGNGRPAVDWEKLRETIEWATRFLDNVINANAYVPSVPQLKEAAHRTRRIGLGIMGLGDLMYHLRVRYGSEEGQELAAQVMEFIRYHAMRTGIELARDGCEAYGCEPVFALAYTRHVNDNGRDLELRYVSPLFLQALREAGLDDASRERIVQQVMVTGSCQDVEDVPPVVRDVFVVAGDITAEEHVRMQAALQAFVDSSISKTINCPATATPDDVARAFQLAWKLGCKGLTVYVTGSRERVVLETEATRRAKQQIRGIMVPATVRPRPHCLEGRTYRLGTPLGTAYITINVNGEGEPFEIFLNVGKAGSDTAAVAEAIGRLISLILRIPSPLSATRRLKQVVKQLKGIGGGRPLGFGRDRVRSLPDGVAQVLAEHLGMVEPPGEAKIAEQLPLFSTGDLCPECGHATLVNEEGCRKCYACGYSEC